MKRKTIKSLLLILLITLFLSSCKKDDRDGDLNVSKEDITQVSGGELNIPLAHVEALNPLSNSDSSAYYFNKLIFEGLFEFDEKLEPSKQLVEEYYINEEGEINLTLKKGVKWHDGEPLKAEDVEFTIDAIKHASRDQTGSFSLSDMYKEGGILNLDSITDVVVKNDRELTITFSENTENIIETLTFPLIAKHVFKGDVGDAFKTDGYIPIGTGPYKQERYEKLKTVSLEAFASYWGKKPLIKNIKGRILKDQQLTLTSFESGQIDATFSLETDWEKYSQDESVDVYEFPSRHLECLAINSKSTTLEGERGNAIRKAIAYGINRKNIIDRVYLGHATLTNSPINPSSYLSDDELNKAYKYNTREARNLLEEIGFTDKDNDGIYEDESGEALTIKLTTNSSNERRVRTLDMISEDLKNIGIEVEKDYELIEDVSDEDIDYNWEQFKSKLDSGDFEIALLGFDTSFTEDFSLLNYRSEEIDKYLLNIKASLSKEEKKKAYANLQKVLLEELPYVNLFFTNGALLVNKKINGEIDPNYINIYRDIDSWFIPKKYQSEKK